MELVTTVPNIGGPAPIPLDLATVTLDVATLVGVYPAFRGRAWGLWLVIISRAITFLPTLPVFFAPRRHPTSRRRSSPCQSRRSRSSSRRSGCAARGLSCRARVIRASVDYERMPCSRSRCGRHGLSFVYVHESRPSVPGRPRGNPIHRLPGAPGQERATRHSAGGKFRWGSPPKVKAP